MTTAAGYETLSVASTMHTGVVTCRPGTPLVKVAQMMAGHRIHSVVVWSEPQGADEEVTLWGVVSDLDVARAIARGEPGVTARTIASAPVLTIDSGETVRRGAELMVEHGVAHLVVVKRGRPVGILSTLDLARALSDQLP